MGGSPRLRSHLARRAISIPAYFLLATLALGSCWIWLPLLAAVDLLRGGRSAALRCALFLTHYLLCECFGLIASFAIWLGRRLGGPAGARRYADWNRALQRAWAAALWNGARRIFGMRLRVEGAELVSQPPLLLLIRHASVADTLIPAVMITIPHQIHMRYVLKRELLWDPCLDVVGNRLPNYFVDRDSLDGAREVQGIASLVEQLGPEEGILIYPEGTRFSPRKRERILARLSRGDDDGLLDRAKQLEHTLPPRLGGTLALLEANPGADVVFCAHTGFEGAASFWELADGALVDRVIEVRFWRVPWAQVPETREGRISWLFDHWKRIDRWIAERA